ncbi:hypothetical protein DL770_000660 [Monosporascus sp. CRB-9-2]|nr:hypothetical protein DL770_000660 [Monosporascus sp. CRB-9-2]
MDSLGPLFNTLAGIGLLLAIARVFGFVSAGWHFRARVNRLQKLGKPMLPHNKLLGHLLQAKYAADDLPPGAHSVYILHRMARKLGQPDAYYFDPYPINNPMLIVVDPYLANQVTSHSWTGAEKPPTLANWFEPISGGGGVNLFTQNGQEWKHDHNLFLPFFSNSNLDAAMPIIVGQLVILRDILRRKAQAGGDIFHLEPLTLSLMNDIIGRVVFNAELGNQTAGSHPLSETMIRQLGLKFATNDVMDNLGQLNPFRKFNTWNNGRILDNHVRDQINKRVVAFRSAKVQEERDVFKSILDQALETYYSKPGRRQSDPVDGNFMKMLCSQLRLFFFAGYDSTSAAMVACCYLIWKHPEVLAKLREEHDKVFGRNLAACADMIAENPAILNSLPYTTAVIKETMRLFPPANGIRVGCADLVLKGQDGTQYPTEGVLVQMNHFSIHRSPEVWARPREFLPERFLVGPGHELYPAKGAWRIFEYGTRNCTGQAFVMKELRAFVALLAREFDFQDCYGEVFAGEKVDLTNVDHEKAYLVEAGSAHLRGPMHSMSMHLVQYMI